MTTREIRTFQAQIDRLGDEIEGVRMSENLKNDEKRAAMATLIRERENFRNLLHEAEQESESKRAAGTPEGRALRSAGAAGDDEREIRGSENGGGMEWRGMLPSAGELRDQTTLSDAAGGATVPTGVAARYVDMLRNAAVFLKGLPAENLIRYQTQNWNMPILSDSDMPALVAENAAITGGDDTWDALEFQSKSYKDIRKATHEVLADSGLSMRNAIANNLVRNVAAQYDVDAFQGDGSATPILGILGQGNSVEGGAATGDTATWDDLGNAVGRIWQGNGNPTVIWAAPDAAIALGNEREGSEGAYITDDSSPLALARRLPVYQSTSLPAGTVAVADGSRIFAGVREDVRVMASEHADFENDRVVFRLTYRVGGLYVVETSSVQVVTVHA